MKTFIPDKTLQTEKSGEGFEFSLGDMGLTDGNNGIPNEHEVLLMVLPANK